MPGKHSERDSGALEPLAGVTAPVEQVARDVSCARVGQGSATRIDPRNQHRQVVPRVRIDDEDFVEPAQEFADIKAREGQRAQIGARLGHE